LQIGLALERNRAWVSLYRALGGGFDPEASQSEQVPAAVQ
jgi:outer membrane protein, multidrug efflux system